MVGWRCGDSSVVFSTKIRCIKNLTIGFCSSRRALSNGTRFMLVGCYLSVPSLMLCVEKKDRVTRQASLG